MPAGASTIGTVSHGHINFEDEDEENSPETANHAGKPTFPQKAHHTPKVGNMLCCMLSALTVLIGGTIILVWLLRDPCSQRPDERESSGKSAVRSLILMVGDGFGQAYLSLARDARLAAAFPDGSGKASRNFPVVTDDMRESTTSTVPLTTAAITGGFWRHHSLTASAEDPQSSLQLSGAGVATLRLECSGSATLLVQIECRVPEGSIMRWQVFVAPRYGAWRHISGMEGEQQSQHRSFDWSPEYEVKIEPGRYRVVLHASAEHRADIRQLRVKSDNGQCFLDPTPSLHLDGLLSGSLGTRSENSLVTDSAAAATALATGHKTWNHYIGELPQEGNGRAVGTILEGAEAAGFWTGLVTTTRLSHATPAAFSAHTPDRGDEELIAQQQLHQNINVLFGGGVEKFTASDRHDGRDLMQEAEALGYQLLRNSDDLRKASAERKEGAAPPRLLGLFARDHLPYTLDSYPSVPTLQEMTKVALQALAPESREGQGLFLLVEGGRIDHAGHANDAPAAAAEALAFDDAVGEALAFVSKQKDALLVVTADHETGGLSVGCCNIYGANLTGLRAARRSSDVIAREIFAAARGIHRGNISTDDTREAVRYIVEKYTGGIVLPDDETSKLADIADRFAQRVSTTRGECQENTADEFCGDLMMQLDGGNTLQYTLASFLAHRTYNIGFTSHGHTAGDVPLYSAGVESALQPGFWENDELGRALVGIIQVDTAEGLQRARDRMVAAGIPFH